jgi:hypothetical protein
MKKLITIGFCIALLSACKEDVLDFDYDPGRIHYDSENFTAPFLPTGTTEAAAKFTPRILDLYEGRQIDAVQVSIYNIPDAASLVFYGDGGKNAPGDILYEEDIRDLLIANQWNTIALTSPLPIPASGDLWMSLRTTQAVGLQVIGCDPGPSKENGDWLYESSDGDWRSFLDRGGDDINWNIRAVVD